MQRPITNQETDIIMPGAEYMVVFRGGQGGNFLSTVLNTALDVDMPEDTAIGANEYYNRNNDALVSNTHINLWFKHRHGDPYGSEKYTVDKYRNMLRIISERGTKLIVLNSTYPMILYTEIVGMIKALTNQHYNDSNNQNKEETSNHKDKIMDSGVMASILLPPEEMHLHKPMGMYYQNYLHFCGIIRHYSNLCKFLDHWNIEYIAVDYAELFIQNTAIQTLQNFLDIPEHNMSALNDSIVNYTLANNQLLKEYNLNFPDYPA